MFKAISNKTWSVLFGFTILGVTSAALRHMILSRIAENKISDEIVNVEEIEAEEDSMYEEHRSQCYITNLSAWSLAMSRSQLPLPTAPPMMIRSMSETRFNR